jgi:hypothetical protein
VVFFNMAKADVCWNFDKNEGFRFCLLPDDHKSDCDEWNAECTAKLKEVVDSARQSFLWQSTAVYIYTNSNQCGFEPIDPQARVLNHCLQ